MHVEPHRHPTPQSRDYLERNGWEEQDDGSWILPDLHEWGMSLTQALRTQERRDQWGH
jgi:hypothetical protein